MPPFDSPGWRIGRKKGWLTYAVLTRMPARNPVDDELLVYQPWGGTARRADHRAQQRVAENRDETDRGLPDIGLAVRKPATAGPLSASAVDS